MAQEFTIKSQQIEDKINQLLPSQGGFQPGVDFSASTMVIPIVDLTETAEGSALRADLQTALSHTSATTFDVSNANTTIINTTGYYRVIGTINTMLTSSITEGSIIINDGATDKIVYGCKTPAVTGITGPVNLNFDFNVFLEAGDQLEVTSSTTLCNVVGSVRQIADINGNLVNP